MSVQAVKGNAAHGRWLDRAVFALDRWLCRCQSIYEYSAQPDCLFRIQLGVVEQSLTLPDGTRLRAGEPMLKLHLWNEHIPPMGPHGPSLAWARGVSRAIEASLRELSCYLGRHAELCEVRVLGGDMRLGNSRQRAQFLRIARRLGFDSPVLRRVPCWHQALHDLGDMLLILLLVLATNPVALRSAPLRHVPSRVYMSRATLVARYRLSGARAVSAQRKPKLFSVPRPAGEASGQCSGANWSANARG